MLGSWSSQVVGLKPSGLRAGDRSRVAFALGPAKLGEASIKGPVPWARDRFLG